MDLTDLVTPTRKIATEAGEAILQVYGADDQGLRFKDDASPLTAADLAANEIIERRLRELTPGWPVLSEESGLPDWTVRKHWKTYWLIDPLDGTKEFVRRNGEFTVNIALIENHRPVLGAVWVPVGRYGYSGAEALGAHRYDASGARPIRSRQSPPEELVVVGSRSHGSPDFDAYLDHLRRQHPAIVTRSIGSSLKICLLAEGTADAYPRLGPTSEWDTAAAHAVLTAAGGKIVVAGGAELAYNSKADILNPHFFASGSANFPWPGVTS